MVCQYVGLPAAVTFPDQHSSLQIENPLAYPAKPLFVYVDPDNGGDDLAFQRCITDTVLGMFAVGDGPEEVAEDEALLGVLAVLNLLCR